MNGFAMAASDAAAKPADAPIRVMIVDDSVVVRNMIMRWLDDEPDIQGVAALRNGREAIDRIDLWKPHVVILDLVMPDLDGITALPRLLEKKPDLAVIVASAHSRPNAKISIQALSLGAADYVLKPQSGDDCTSAASFRSELVNKIRALCARRRQRPLPGRLMQSNAGNLMPRVAPAMRSKPLPKQNQSPRVLVIGASTGGPKALNVIASQLGPVIDKVPVLIAQHMPPTFTPFLADHLAHASGRPSGEAVEAEPVRAGKIYVAPGGRHMRVKRHGQEPVIALSDDPAINFCKPAVDYLFASTVPVWGAAIMALVLTGMGNDGVRGADQIAMAGGSILVQDEESSVVWGMGSSVVQAGLATEVLPLHEIGPRLVRAICGTSS